MAPSSVVPPPPAPLPPGYELRCQLTAASALGQQLRRLRAAALEQPASLGCFAVLMVGLGLGGITVVEGLRMLGKAEDVTLDLVNGLTLAMLLLVVALLSLLLLLSLRSLTRSAAPPQRSQRRHKQPLKQQWQLRQGKATVARLELIGPCLPDDDGLQLRRLRLDKRFRHKGLGRQFVWAVLAQTPQRCYVQIPQSSQQAAQVAFFQSCGFVWSQAPVPNGRSAGAGRSQSRRPKLPAPWMVQGGQRTTLSPSSDDSSCLGTYEDQA